MKGPIATFETMDINKLAMYYASRANPLASTIAGISEEDVDLSDSISKVTFRAKDVAVVMDPDSEVQELFQDLKENAQIELTHLIAVRLNKETTGMEQGLVIVNTRMSDFLIWWNEYGK